MARYRENLPQLEAGIFVAYVGMETDLIFTKGIDLPGFASYPLLETEEGRTMLAGYYRDLIEVGKANDTGVILESPTWVANRDRGAELGYAPARLIDLNKQAIALMSEVRAKAGDLPTVLGANIGPRDDAYAPGKQMTEDEAEAYHFEQVAALAETETDLISGYTVAYPAEATGMVLAAKRVNLPVVISFTVETDGRLPTGSSLKQAIEEVDGATDSSPAVDPLSCDHSDGSAPAAQSPFAAQGVNPRIGSSNRHSARNVTGPRHRRSTDKIPTLHRRD